MKNGWHIISIITLLLLTLVTRWGQIDQNLPFFYDEDEAHHFNRQVEMLQSRDPNPRYFLKPTLNFYLRLPALAAGFFYDVKKQRIRTIGEVQTKSEFGLAGYNFVPTHPTLVKADRLLTVLISLATILLVYWAAILLSAPPPVALLSSLILLCSPLAIMHSGSVGVNQPAAFLIMASVTAAIAFLKLARFRWLILSAAAAGAAISTKYNALPVMFSPLLAAVLVRSRIGVISFGDRCKFFLTALILPWLFFVACSPYMLIEIGLFLDHVAYEIWHYSIAGHVGHQTEPGLAQLIFYLKTAATVGVGLPALIISGFGLGLIALKPKRLLLYLPAVLATLVYLTLMSAQKANFARNLLLILPLLALLTVPALAAVYDKSRTGFYVLGIFVLIPLVIGFPRNEFAEDSRLQAKSELLNMTAGSEVFIDGELELPAFTTYKDGQNVLIREGITRGTAAEMSLSELWQAGYHFALLPQYRFATPELTEYAEVLRSYRGFPKAQRIIKNPAMLLVKFKRFADLPAQRKFEVMATGDIVKSCDQAGPVWLKHRISQISLDKCDSDAGNLTATIFSPWPEQKLKVFGDLGEYETAAEVSVSKTSEIKLRDRSYIAISRIQSPQAHGLSADNRRLGVQITPDTVN